MTENLQPRNYDAVMGGQNPPPINAVVLGGIEGIKKRLVYPDEEIRIAALKDAIKYGEAGLDLVIQALYNEANKVKFTAYSLLKDRTELKVKQQLDNFLPLFDFDVITVNECGQEISRCRQFAQYFTEDLQKGVFLEMVSIPGGTFLMGSPNPQKEYEIPQHKVTVPSFFMGKYQVTQSQWEAVAVLPPIRISLNGNPSYFKGANRPVENVSWYEAQEFCARLSRKTGKNYRLPSEAEWEYACRAGTTTSFYFGETITSDLVNYDGTYTYGCTPIGIKRDQTTDVGSFPPNSFGLYDMYGNVSEWCADIYHPNYNGATSDGSVWESGRNNGYRVQRGGSWDYTYNLCYSTSRAGGDAGGRFNVIGFRVACT